MIPEDSSEVFSITGSYLIVCNFWCFKFEEKKSFRYGNHLPNEKSVIARDSQILWQVLYRILELSLYFRICFYLYGMLVVCFQLTLLFLKEAILDLILFHNEPCHHSEQ